MAATSGNSLALPGGPYALPEDGGSSPVPVWTAQVLNSGEACWQMVETGQQAMQQRRKRHVQRLFHQGRALVLKHLPRDVTEHEIREALNARGWKTASVTLSAPGAGPHWARVVPLQAENEPDFWEDWRNHLSRPGENNNNNNGTALNVHLRGHKVSVSPSASENLLCIARLPRDLLDDEFKELVAAHGPVKRCFLLYSDRTGESKGYGFVEYATRETGQRARAQLDGKAYEGQTLGADWLDASIVTVAGLHSKLLYVDGLPDGFRDMGQFRKLFSQIAHPPYCQIALKGGAPQDWGLVEFSQAQEAEDTLRALDGKLFHNAPIRVAFFMPGVRAINIYMKLINETCHNKGRAALLPEPPSDTVFHQLQNLTKQNPAFVHSLQNIILTQIQHLNSSSAAPASLSSAVSGQSCPTGGVSSNASLAASAQAALSMLLAAQQPQQTTPVPAPVPPPPTQQPPPPMGRVPQYGAYRVPLQQQQQQQQQQQTFPAMMEAPPLNINVPPPPFNYRPPAPPSVASLSSVIEPAVSNLQQTLSALLGTLSSAVQSLTPGVAPAPNPLTQQQTAAGALLGLLLQMVQNPQPAVSPVQQQQQASPLAPLSLSTLHHEAAPAYGSGGLLTTAPSSAQYTNYLPPPAMCSPSSTSMSSSSSSSSSSSCGNVNNWNHVLGQVRSLSSGGPSSLGSTGSRGSSPTSSSSPSTSPARTNGTLSSNSFVTPTQGTKRKYNNHVLPSPEPSPEANYVGQHSQGIGGHYADSYFKRKKRN